MTSIYRLALIFVVAFVSSCASQQKTADGLAAKGYRQASSEEVNTLLAGNTIHGTFIRRPTGVTGTVTVFVGADGSLTGEVSVGVAKHDTGRWEVRPGGLFCDSYRTWQAGWDCDRVFVRGNEFVLVNLDGSISSKGQIEEGNSRGL
jgi:hypothetical protein